VGRNWKDIWVVWEEEVCIELSWIILLESDNLDDGDRDGRTLLNRKRALHYLNGLLYRLQTSLNVCLCPDCSPFCSPTAEATFFELEACSLHRGQNSVPSDLPSA
jgi:hypothetical protein